VAPRPLAANGSDAPAIDTAPPKSPRSTAEEERAARLATYARPAVIKRGEDAADAMARRERKRKRDEGRARNKIAEERKANGNEGGGMSKAAKKNLARKLKKAARATATA